MGKVTARDNDNKSAAAVAPIIIVVVVAVPEKKARPLTNAIWKQRALSWGEGLMDDVVSCNHKVYGKVKEGREGKKEGTEAPRQSSS